MKRCKHVQFRFWTYTDDASEEVTVKRMCIDCGHWMSLGPSNDSDERVQIELRAVLVADEFAKRDDSELLAKTSMSERRGWWMHAQNERSGSDFWIPTKREEWAGYLARCIAEHKDSP